MRHSQGRVGQRGAPILGRRATKVLRGWPLLSLGFLAAFGCAAQEANDNMPDDGGSGSSSSGSSSGGSSSGSGGSKATGGSGSGNGGSKTTGGSSSGNGGSPVAGAGMGGSDDGGSGGMAGMAGTGGNGGSAGSGGKAGSGGGGSGGSSGSGGKGGSSGSSGSGGSSGAPTDTCKNGKVDMDETDVDCGGKVCTARCATDKDCELVTDCVQTPTGNVCDVDTCRQSGCNQDNCAYALTRLIDGSSAARGQAFVTWDSDSLDVEVQMIDATVFNDSDPNWEDDSVEVYLDLNNAGAGAYDADDYQITVPRAAGALSGTANYTQGSIVVDRTSDAAGYTLKISIPWSALSGAASQVGKTIGFDIGVNDDSDGGTRNGQLMLYGGVNNYQNASAFGDLVLTP